MFCILAVFVPSFFMVGVGRQLFVPLSLAVAFSMIASYLLSSSLVPVFSTWLMKEAHRGEEREGLFGHLRSFYSRYLNLRPAASLAAGDGLPGRLRRLCSVFSCRAWEPRFFPMSTLRCSASACARPPARESKRPSASSCAPSTSSIATSARNNVEITSDFVGVVPSSYPVDLIHLFTSGPQEAIIQVALKPDAPRGEALREKLRDSSARANCRAPRSPSKPATSSPR